MPPPAKVLAEPEVRLIVPVPVTDTFVPLMDQELDVPAIDQVPDPTATVLVNAPDDIKPTADPEADEVKL